MRTVNPRGGLILALLGGCMLLLSPLIHAFPPAPYHQIKGMVRTALGEPLYVEGATVVFESAAGISIQGYIAENPEPGINYQLRIPMDAGLTEDAYKATALQPWVPFTMKVVVGGLTYLPMEMNGNLARLGEPTGISLINLTLGVDLDGDGLPDEWELLLAKSLGGDLGIADILPGDDPDADGINNLAEYRAGTYAYDPEDGFRLNMVLADGGSSLLEFMAIRGHRYSLYTSTDLEDWVPAGFLIPAKADGLNVYESYLADDVGIVRVQVVTPEGEPVPQYFKVLSH
jgi:hypothetical protein